ncbi:hypothetical protein ABMC10_05670 [Anaerostipes caccae]|uniref:Uncharacterized protein n=3 Tax=Anaerostipes caccae TaxID=105841 RepID=B0MER6_ANACD|nr:hypothetical protein [Anaerostipes caccae]EDR97454.1 hypothetical protein ANACAC_02066 [Anaerostipes caccae L1-92]
MIKEKLKWEGEMKYILFFLGMGLFIFNKFFPELREGILGDFLITAIMVFAIINLMIQRKKSKKDIDNEE